MRKAVLLFSWVFVGLSLSGCGAGGSATGPSAHLSVSPTGLSFSATVGQPSATQTVTVTNSGSAAAVLQTATLSGVNASDFSITENTCATNSTLGVSAYCTLTLQFQPTAVGNRTATLTIPSSGVGSLTVALSGTGNSLANVSISPSNLTFASTPINQTAPAQAITVSNSGGTAATLATPVFTGTDAVDFSVASTTCTNSLAANATCSIQVAFTPTASGTRTASLTFSESSLGVANTFTAALTGTGAPADLGLQGSVLSGSQPIADATIQLYTVGAAGNGSAARAMLNSTVTTNAAGNFYLATGSPLALSFSCANSSDQVYAVATGGNPGLTPAVNNAALVMVTALGNCGSLTTSSSITINELTTAAAAWALAPFAASAANIGSSATNKAGITNAMLDAQLLANSSTGASATLASNLSLEPGKLAALADALAPCVDSGGGSACAPLFAASTPSGGTAPSDTFAAALSVVKHPAQNVAAVYALIPSTPPYAITLTQAPNDWTLSLAISGGGLSAPTALDIDSRGNIWVADYNGGLSGFSPQGTPLSSTAFGTGSLDECYGLTIDSSGNIWVADQVYPTNTAGAVTRFVPNGTGGFTSTHVYYDSSIQYPVGLAADTNGDIFIANYASSAVTAYTSAGAPLASHGTGLGSGSVAGPVAVAADSAHGVWIANSQSSTVTHVSATGSILSNLACCAGTNGSNGIATDSAGNAWISDFGANAFSMISTGPSGDTLKIDETPLLGSAYTAGPAGIAVDAAQNIWIANFRGESISEIAGINSSSPLGTVLSPAAGFGYPSAPTPTPRLLAPESLAPDASGNLWVTDNGNNNLVMFFGLATPTKTPIQPTPVAP